MIEIFFCFEDGLLYVRDGPLQWVRVPPQKNSQSLAHAPAPAPAAVKATVTQVFVAGTCGCGAIPAARTDPPSRGIHTPLNGWYRWVIMGSTNSP
jgi:hypothetical protein